MEKIKAVGGNNATAVSKNTFVVLVKDTDEDTGKADQARKLNIPLMTPNAFQVKYFAIIIIRELAPIKKRCKI